MPRIFAGTTSDIHIGTVDASVFPLVCDQIEYCGSTDSVHLPSSAEESKDDELDRGS